MRDFSKFCLAAAQCLMGIGAVALVTFVCFQLHLSLMEPTFLYLIVIVLLSLRSTFFSAALVSFIAVGCLDYYFLPPIFSFTLADPVDIVTIIAFLTTSFVITHLVSKVRKLMEEKLQQSEHYLAEAQRLSHTGSLAWKPSDNRIVWSEETFRILQFETRTQPTLEQILQRIHPEDAVWVRPTLERAAQEGTDFDYEHRFSMPDGSFKHVRIVAHAQRDRRGELEFVGAVMDVTAAKEGEDKIRLIINTVPGLLWTARPDGWVDFLNQRWLDYTGMTLDQGLGWAWQPGYHPDDLENVLIKWRAAVAEKKPLEVEARLRRFDGEYRWYLKRAFPLFDNAGNVLGWYGGNIDVHDLKQAEAALRRSETYLAEAQKLSHTGSWARSIATGEITYWSAECFRVLGFDPHGGQTQFETFLQRVHPDDQDKVRKIAETAARDKVEYEVDYRIVHPDGQMRDIHAIGHPVFSPSGDLIEYVGTVIDVTERMRAQEALRRSEAYLSEAQKLMRTGSWAMDPRTSRVVHFSEETYRIFELDPREGLPGIETLLGRVHPEDRDKVAEATRKVALDKAGHTLDYRLSLPAGRVKYIHSIRHPVLNAAGETVEIMGTMIDITERKEAEEALRETRAALAHVTRVTTLGELTASIAHEVNQPLGAVVTNANACLRWLDRAVPDLDEARDAARRIVRDGNRGAEVISRIRGMVKKEQPARVRLNVNDVVQEIIALTRADLQGATLQIELAPELPPVAADRVQLQQVLLNLTMNAIDAMKPVNDRPRLLRIGTEDSEGLGVVVAVQDSGVGLDSNGTKKVFETFYTTKPGGLGMGLSICRSIIEEHGGRLWAEPNEGPGATFRFSLPCEEEENGA